MRNRESADLTFEVQSAYLEGWSDLAALVLAASEKAQRWSASRSVLIKELQAICSNPSQYVTEGAA